jgi:putative heme utilization carrier protein HutX
VWTDLTDWGEISFVAHSADGVFASKGMVPPGSLSRGYYNFHGNSPIGGNIRAARCRFIDFVNRPFFGRRFCSVQVVDEHGGVMVKVFVGRNSDRSPKEDQTARFKALRARL